MSKTAEDQIKNAAKSYTELQSLGTSNDYQAFIAGAYFASSSKDARIKELEEFIDKDFASIVIQTADLKTQIKELEEENNGLKEQRQNDMMLASSAVNHIKELEARLETAEKFIGEIGSNIHLPKWVKKKANAFLTNKTE